MGFAYDSDSPKRDPSVSVEEELRRAQAAQAEACRPPLHKRVSDALRRRRATGTR